MFINVGPVAFFKKGHVRKTVTLNYVINTTGILYITV
jgi:hypothetical protein